MGNWEERIVEGKWEERRIVDGEMGGKKNCRWGNGRKGELSMGKWEK